MKRLIFAALLAFGTAAHAFTGNQLLTIMQDKDLSVQMVGLAYVRGFLDASSFQYLTYRVQGGKQVSGEMFCMPEGVTLEQARDVVKASLESQPGQRHVLAGALVLAAFVKTWPCK